MHSYMESLHIQVKILNSMHFAYYGVLTTLSRRVIRRAMPGRPQEVLRSAYLAYLLSCKGIGALYGNNLVSPYQLSSVDIGQNWIDQ